jgi:hypothetical protein
VETEKRREIRRANMQSEIKKHNNFGWKKLAYDAISMVFKKDLVA